MDLDDRARLRGIKFKVIALRNNREAVCVGMAPIKGLINKKKKGEKQVDQGVVVVPADATMEPQPQPLDWWDDFCARVFGPLPESETPLTFEMVFKISRRTFDYICSLVNDEMAAKQFSFSFSNGEPLLLNDMVAIALKRLSSGASLAIIGDAFGLSHSTVSQVTWRFVEAMEETALHHLMWPAESEMGRIKSTFEKVRGLPNCCGVIDITHIIMNIPSSDLSNRSWCDRENNYSMLLQAVIDPEMRFRDMIIGWPGSLTDSGVLLNSALFQLCEKGELLIGEKLNLSDGTEIREYVIGDTGFPLLPWLITPFKGKDLSDIQLNFNKRLSATRFVAQRAFSRLKEMWQIINGVMWMPDKSKLPRIILVCCLLHNILIDMDDDVMDELSLAYTHDDGYGQQRSEYVDEAGAVAREKLALHLSGELPPAT